jgi:hypothetical protein
MKYGGEIAGMAPMMVSKLIELFQSYIGAGQGATFFYPLCVFPGRAFYCRVSYNLNAACV